MKISRKIITIILISFLTFSILSIFERQISYVGAQLPEIGPGYGASLTGYVDDTGVDANGNGLFDYLQISVEVNVTFPWKLYSVEVYELVARDLEDSYSRHIYIRQSAFVYPKAGLQLVNVSLYGPTIYDSGLNPEKIYRITLSETYPEYSSYYGFRWYSNVIDSLYDVPLSKEYSYTEFDPPFTDVEAKFVVYPDGRVVISGGLNSTSTMSPFAGMSSLKGLVMQGDASLTTTGPRTVISRNNTILFPPEYASKFPLNSTTMSMLETYSGDVFNTGTNCTVILPPYIASKFPFNTTDASLSVTYSEGLLTTEIEHSTTVPATILPPHFEVPPGSEQLFDFIHFLLNLTDVSIVGEYQNGELSGNITISMLPGFALGSLDIDFQGNQTDFSLSGNITVFYGSFYGFEINEETLNMMLQQLSLIQGRGSGSLYDITDGVLECTRLTTTKTTITDPPGSMVDFEVVIHGDFLEAFAKSILPFLPPQYWRYMSPEEKERLQTLIYSVLKAAISSVQTTSFELGYTHSTREASMKFTFVDDVGSFVDEFLPLVPGIYAKAFYLRLVPRIHPLILDTLPDILNKTFSCTKTASVQMTYTKADRKFDFKTTAVAEGIEQVREDATQLIVEMLQNVTLIPPEVLPSQMRTLTVSLLNTTYCSLESYESSLTYKDGRQDKRETYTIQGDLNAELNYVKEIFLEFLLAPHGVYPTSVPWQLSFINQTEIDIRNLRVSYNFTETLITGNIDGFGIWPPINVINATRFQLRELFSLTNSTYPYEPPRKGERLKITIEGGSNITHAVMLFRPQTVPEPNETAPDLRRMVWYNQSLSDLKDMEFKIQTQAYNAIILVTDQMDNPIPNAAVKLYYPNGTLRASLLTDDYGNTTPILVDYAYMPFGDYNLTATYAGVSKTVPLTIGYTGIYSISIPVKGPQIIETITAPKLVNATETAATILNITEISKPVEIIVRNVTAPEGVDPPPGTWKVVGNYVQITVNETEITVSATMHIYYTPEQLSKLGLDESSLTIYCWNATESKWIQVESRVNTEEHYVWATVSHLSIWVLMGQPLALWEQPWFLISITVIIVIVIVAVLLGLRRKKQSP